MSFEHVKTKEVKFPTLKELAEQAAFNMFVGFISIFCILSFGALVLWCYIQTMAGVDI